ncbi:MAG TPA: hypothetical protein VKO67_06955 [Smithellaceae bacterium]|nr:hypothetical protein [Smithellaceae bacterium]
MSNGRNSGPIIPITGIIALLTIVGISYYSQTPFRGTRPYSSEIQYERYREVTARLWQDPFSAVLAHLKQLDKSDQSEIRSNVETIHLREGIILRQSKNAKTSRTNGDSLVAQIGRKEGRVTILGAMVPGTIYAEDEESRMRQRYAVVSALRSLKYLPEDSEHIRYALLKTDGERKNPTPLLKNILPYEWFYRAETKESVVLLWLNEKTFQNDPLKHFSKLKHSLGNAGDRKWVIIGPCESMTLKHMLSELDRKTGSSELNNLQGFEIYSAFATADAASLLDDNKNTVKNDAEIVGRFGKKDILFSRIIGSDKALAVKIVDELKNRRVDFNNEKKRIILVSESDTLYAGALQDVFRKELPMSPELKKPDLLISVGYLRGIDGILPGEKAGKADSKEGESNQTNKTDFDVSKLEKPAGKSQYDYLRRHADKIYHRLERGQRDVVAIGILGSDFHDKYLALQAFHQRFPQAIYFTTDLDAMWFHPASLQWTRNLLVASHFNISVPREMSKDMQESPPSFRDCYQTSAFMAVRQAFSGQRQYQPEPLLFEIGNTGAVKLSERKKSNYSYTRLMILAIFLMAVIFLTILFFSNKPVNRTVMSILKSKWKLMIVLAVAGLAVLMLVVMNMYILTKPDEEPFSLVNGISVWPANIFRMAAFILSVSFICFSYRSLKNNEQDIWDQLFRKAPKVERWSNFPKSVVSSDFFKAYSNGDISALWDEYAVRNGWQYRICWAFGAWIVYFVTTGLFLSVLGPLPNLPVRGVYSYWITMIIFFLSTFFFSVLFLYIFDVTRLCHQFIVNVTEKYHEWPEESLQRFLEGSKQNYRQEQIMVFSEWQTVYLVAQRTEAVGGLIFYPSIITVIMFAARHSYFDNWNTTIPLAVILLIGVMITWICALIQRTDAEKFRKASILRLKEQQMRVILRKDLQDLKSQIDYTIEDIQSIKRGAFLPFSQHPVFQSIMLALSGIGGTYLIEFANALSF